jgi:hypothetical protein
MSDKGVFISEPNQWFNLSSVNELIADQLELATVLKVYGSFEDPNRRVEARNLVMDPVTHAPALDGGFVAVNPYEMVIDRQPPAAELQVGLRWRASKRLVLQGTLYNAFSGQRGSYDNANDLEARLELTPMKFESFRFFSSAVVTF